MLEQVFRAQRKEKMITVKSTKILLHLQCKSITFYISIILFILLEFIVSLRKNSC